MPSPSAQVSNLEPKYKAFCPVCKERVTGWNLYAGYVAEIDGGWPVGGTLVVTGEQVAHRDEPDLTGRISLCTKMEPFRAEDYWIFQPCGHAFTGEMQLDVSVDWKEWARDEERLKVKLVLMVMQRLQCKIETDDTGLSTCTKHCASVEDWADPPASRIVCLHAVTEAGLTGGE